jgi:DNA-binding transcriptional ArsR family regulator
MKAASWNFLTNHAQVLLRITQDPGARLRDIAASLGITERSAYSIITDLTDAGYVVKHKDGRRNRYQIQAHLPLPDPVGRERAIGDVLAVLTDEAEGAAGRRATRVQGLDLHPGDPDARNGLDDVPA